MWHKIKWLTLWTTLAFWFGGCGATHPLALNSDDADVLPPAQSFISEPPAPAAPSLTGIDRINWEPITIAPTSGAVQHHPVYFSSDAYLAPSRRSPLTSDSDIEREAELATSADRIATADLAQIGLEPLQFAGDMVLLPVRLVMTPPWSVQLAK
jgi:hypothetical protein